MKQKTIGLLCASILVAVIFLSFGAAAITFTSVPNAGPYETSFDLGISSNVTEDVLIEITTITDNGESVVFASQTMTMTASTSSTATMIYNTNNFNFELGQIYSTTITTTGQTSGDIDTTTLSFEEVTFCEDCENQGNLDLRVEDITVVNGFGDDDDYWYAFDEIEVELEIENSGNWDIDNIEIEWALYTTNGKKIMDDTLNDFNLKDGKDEKIIFTFILDEDIDEFESEDAVLYIKAKGEIDDNDSPFDGNDTCDSDKKEVEVYGDDDFIILENIKINGVGLIDSSFNEYPLRCGQEVTITAKAWNIGANDQEDVELYLYNQELGFNEKLIVGDIDGYEDQEISFTIILPKEVDEKWYNFQLNVYDEDLDLFENSKDDESTFDVYAKLEGACGYTEPIIKAELLTEAVENSEMKIKVNIQNIGSKTMDYSLNVARFADWAELVDVSERNFELTAGSSKEITITFNTNKESAGERFFDIELLSDNQLVSKQPVLVSIEEVENKVKDFITNNWKILVIALVNLILVIAIIIVAVRTYRR